MRHFFTINGTASEDFGVYIGGQETFNSPMRDVERVSIPGKNGDLIIDHGRWNNIIVTYNAVIMDDFAENADAFSAWLSSLRGYNKLTDTYHPDWFRLAAFHEDIEFITAAFNSAGKAQIRFDCKPQKFLQDGTVPLVLSRAAGERITNPTDFESRPIIQFYCNGSGTITVNDTVVSVTNESAETLYLDSELYDCYNSSKENRNSKISLSKFPVLKPGANTISWTGDVDAVEVIGRWFIV